MSLVWIALGGAAGAVTRHLVGLALQSSLWGTLAVNVVGCSLAVALTQACGEDRVRVLFLVTGFCGAFTTFSAFSSETWMLVQEGRQVFAGCYVAANNILGLGAAWGTWKLMS